MVRSVIYRDIYCLPFIVSTEGGWLWAVARTSESCGILEEDCCNTLRLLPSHSQIAVAGLHTKHFLALVKIHTNIPGAVITGRADSLPPGLSLLLNLNLVKCPASCWRKQWGGVDISQSDQWAVSQANDHLVEFNDSIMTEIISLILWEKSYTGYLLRRGHTGACGDWSCPPITSSETIWSTVLL